MNNTEQDPIRLPMGVSDFKKLITDNYHFVDKTLFIKEVIQDGADVILITRPRRFGKTLNLSMLHYFLRIDQQTNQNLFENLNISQDKRFCEKHQNKYPAIFVSFKDIKKVSYEQAYEGIVALMRNLYSDHRYLLEGNTLAEDEKEAFISILRKQANQTEIEGAIKRLSVYLLNTFNTKPIILIDEYDTPIQQAYLKGYYDEMIDLMRNIFGESLKDSTPMGKAIITGITRIAQESLFSGVNNFEVYSVLKPKYGQYFGFTEPEVARLVEKTGNRVTMNVVREWYNGYRIGPHLVYNPWSILMCLKNDGQVGPHWLNTSSNDLIKMLVTKANFKVRQHLDLLLQGQTIERPLMENLVFRDLEKREEAIWSLLLYAGYLNVLSSELKDFRLMAQISVPNKEVMFIYDEIVSEWFVRDTSLDFYTEFIESLVAGQIDEFKIHLCSYLMETGSYFDFNQNTPEQVFHSFMLGLVVGLKRDYIIQSNQESGLGRFDVIFIPKTDKTKNGILLEFKVSKEEKLLPNKAQEALQQIKDQKYLAAFKLHGIKSVLAIGMAFCGKQVELAYENMTVA